MYDMTVPVTVDNYEAVANSPKYGDRPVEVIKGRIVVMPHRTAGYGELLLNIAAVLGNFVEQHSMGRVAAGGVAILLERNESEGDTIRGVDIAYFSHAKAPEPLPYRVLDLVPDLAIQVMSPDDPFMPVRNKVRQLLGIGCPQVWIVVPDDREVDVHSAAGISTYGEGDTINAGDALPGFEIAVADIFPS